MKNWHFLIAFISQNHIMKVEIKSTAGGNSEINPSNVKAAKPTVITDKITRAVLLFVNGVSKNKKRQRNNPTTCMAAPTGWCKSAKCTINIAENVAWSKYSFFFVFAWKESSKNAVAITPINWAIINSP